ncbi:MAG: hypothetical protein FD152_1049 [Xanthobacteraceae bacterium]|nr:MAG: hypothetical protein FD152_1049 [Xanthobacteraceae bacterium]
MACGIPAPWRRRSTGCTTTARGCRDMPMRPCPMPMAWSFLAAHPTLSASVEVGQRLYRRPDCCRRLPALRLRGQGSDPGGNVLRHPDHRARAVAEIRRPVPAAPAPDRQQGAQRPPSPNVYLATITLKAWNTLRTGKTVRSLKWQTDAACSTEPFPGGHVMAKLSDIGPVIVDNVTVPAGQPPRHRRGRRWSN